MELELALELVLAAVDLAVRGLAMLVTLSIGLSISFGLRHDS